MVNAALVNAQQLSKISESVLRRFGDVHFNVTSSAVTQLDHFVSIALGNSGGALVIGADNSIAIQLAARMFDKPANQLQLADCIDALSELGNIMAGRLEFQFGSERCLGIPAYMSADSKRQIWPALSVEAEIWSSFAGHAFYIAVVADHPSTPRSRG